MIKKIEILIINGIIGHPYDISIIYIRNSAIVHKLLPDQGLLCLQKC